MSGTSRLLPAALPALGLLAFAPPAVADSWVLSTPAYSLTFTDLWHPSDTVVHPALNTVINHGGYTLDILGIPVDTLPDLDTESGKRAAAALPAQGRPERTWDSLEVQGGYVFLAAEWRDTSTLAADPLIRARTYALEKGGILFIATFRYRPGGCSSHLFSLRAALATLSLKTASPVRRPQSSRGGAAPSARPREGRDALGRWTGAGPWLQIYPPQGKSHPGYGPVSKAARLQGLPQPLPYHGCSDSPP